MHRAVVLGSRFGGLAVIAWLRRLFPASELAITVVDQWEEMVFRPGLVHAMDKAPESLVDGLTIPLRPYWKSQRAEAVHDTIVAIDPERRRVHTATHRPIPYDVLFVATGASPRWDAIDGLNFHRAGVCEGYLARHTAAVNQRQYRGHFVFATGPIFSSPEWRPQIHVGCECPLFESALLWDRQLRKAKQRDKAQITIVTPSPQMAETAGTAGQNLLAALLKRRGIEVVTGAEFVRVTDQAIELVDRTIPADRMVWLPPQGGSPWLTQSGVADPHGWLPVDGHMNHPDWPDIYGIGDIISRPWPKMGHSAMVQARVAVHHWAYRQRKIKSPGPAYSPRLVWILEDNPGTALFVLSNRFWGGSQEIVFHNRLSYMAKQVFQWTYIKRSGSLPIMP